MSAELSVPGSATRRDVLRTGALAAGAVVGGAALIGAVAPAASAAPRDIPTGGHVDYWMHIDGISGFSTVRGHEHDVPLLSMSWGVSSPVTSPRPGGGTQAGRPSVGEVSVFFTMGPETVPLLAALMGGQHLSKVELVAEAAPSGGQPQEFLRYTLESVMVSSFQTSASDSVPSQSLTLNFASMTVKYAYSNGNDASEELQIKL